MIVKKTTTGFPNLLELQLGVDPHVADLTVEGAFLRVGFRGGAPALLSPHLRTQAGVCFDGPKAAPRLLDGFVFGTLEKKGKQGLCERAIKHRPKQVILGFMSVMENIYGDPSLKTPLLLRLTLDSAFVL